MVELMRGIGFWKPKGPLGWAVAAWAALAVVGLLLFGLSELGGGPAGDGQSAPASRPAPSVPGRGAGQPSAGPPPPVTQVATVLNTAPRYAGPGQREQSGDRAAVPSSWWQRPSVLPVIATRPGWVQVRLAQRPNGSTAWLPASDVKLGSTPYRIIIHLAARRLDLYEYGSLVMSAPAGIGAATDPTPPGQYFVAFDEDPPGPGYGPFVLVTSAHSPNIADWDGSGDGIIGIHGPLGDDAEIGTTGARISHGCIRLHLADQQQLSVVPAGTLIDIVQ
jgi:lipoprotein-anchoring transpeptidase ErfK/SrfK